MSTNKKYEILKTHSIIHTNNDIIGIRVYRIRALKDIPSKSVKKGDLGGYVECDKNLSQEGTCWVAGEATVFSGAHVIDSALVCDNAEVSHNSTISDRAVVKENAKISFRSHIYEDAVVSGSAYVHTDTNIFGRALICGNAEVNNKSQISGLVIIGDSAKVSNSVLSLDQNIHDNDVIVDVDGAGSVKSQIRTIVNTDMDFNKLGQQCLPFNTDTFKIEKNSIDSDKLFPELPNGYVPYDYMTANLSYLNTNNIPYIGNNICQNYDSPMHDIGRIAYNKYTGKIYYVSLDNGIFETLDELKSYIQLEDNK